MELTDREVAVVRAALISAKDTIENLASEEGLIPDFVQGFVVGAFLGIPQQLKKALSVLNENKDEPETDSSE